MRSKCIIAFDRCVSQNTQANDLNYLVCCQVVVTLLFCFGPYSGCLKRVKTETTSQVGHKTTLKGPVLL